MARYQLIDETAARELDLYAENTSELYGQFQSIVRNILRKVRSGKYDPARALGLLVRGGGEAVRQGVRRSVVDDVP